MRFLAMALVSLAAVLPPAGAAESLKITQARAEIERVRELVSAGAVPKVRLEEAEQALASVQDEEILARTLYGPVGIEQLTEDQSKDMVAAAKRQAERQKVRLDAAKRLVDEGAAARTTLTTLLEDLDRSRKTVDLAESRARLFNELMAMARAELEADLAALTESVREPAESKADAVRFDGSGMFSTTQARQVMLAYEREFARPMPISARGDTAFHRSLGYDHRGRIDVALHPDDKEGVWLRHYLEAERIPYFAFRKSIPGSASAAHIHIGPPSTRLRTAD